MMRAALRHLHLLHARAVLVGVLAAVACAPKTSSGVADVFRVAVPYLPNQITPRSNRINVYHYINLQLYYPLMQRDAADGVLRSEFLDMGRTRALSTSFSKYVLCLAPGVAFTDGRSITAQDLENSLRQTHAYWLHPEEVHSESVGPGCVAVSLDRPDPAYFDRLTGVASTVLKIGTEKERIPLGRGPYVVDQWGPTELSLHFVGSEFARFPRIRLTAVCSLQDAVSQRMDDINLLYWEPGSRDGLGYVRWQREVLRTYGLVVSHSDARLRAAFARCLNTQRFVDEVFPVDLQPSGWLPHGLLGGERVLDVQATDAGYCRSNADPAAELVYINHLPSIHEKLVRFFSSSPMPIRVSVVTVAWAEYLQSIKDHRPMVYAVGMDTANSQTGIFDEASVFFEPFTSDARCIDERLDAVETLVAKGRETRSYSDKAKIYAAAHNALVDSHYVVPLGQMLPALYYSKRVKHVEFADPLIGYPRIDKMKAD